MYWQNVAFISPHFIIVCIFSHILTSMVVWQRSYKLVNRTFPSNSFGIFCFDFQFETEDGLKTAVLHLWRIQGSILLCIVHRIMSLKVFFYIISTIFCHNLDIDNMS